MSKSSTKLFERLGAPLHNYVWSWGAVREADGVVFFRVWSDEKDRNPSSGKWMYRLTLRQCFEGQGNNGYNERAKHLALVEQGAKCYLVIVRGAKPEVLGGERKIEGVKDDSVFPVIRLVKDDADDYWGEVSTPVTIDSVLL